jgi:phosphoglycerol transferase MdoB-like AlkP superfamily enzyme
LKILPENERGFGHHGKHEYRQNEGPWKSKNLTPFLDSLSREGLYFENAYSAGIHTFNGIFSILFSYPALFRQHPMKESAMRKFSGLATNLEKHGYTTSYFTTHDGQFDNVEGFLKLNDYDHVIEKSDYPAEEVKTTLGVPDDFMFRFSLPILDGYAKQGKPFFNAFMTASDHPPHYIPPYFRGKSQKDKDLIVEYADYLLGTLVKAASRKPWFQNTLFVFVADHGAVFDTDFELSLAYNHVLLLFYAPGLKISPKIFSEMAGQIDVFPSIMGFLGMEFDNKTMGIDLFQDDRPYIFFNADDKFAVIDQNWLSIEKEDRSFGLFHSLDRDKKHWKKKEAARAKSMKLYGESYLQSYQDMLLQTDMARK